MQIKKLQDFPQLLEDAVCWFHSKWGIPAEAYRESMAQCMENTAPVPQWYVAMENDRIIGGLGVIENDFHNRPDLTPNVCAVYVEKAYRRQGIAGKLLQFACQDMQNRGVDTLYLLTDHTSFYERYGWVFFCMAQGDGEAQMSRMYIHKGEENASEKD